MFWHYGWEAWGGLSFPTRDETNTLFIGRQSFNHWIAREVLPFLDVKG